MKKLKIFVMLAILLASIFVSTVQGFNEPLPVTIKGIWVNDKEVDLTNPEVRGDIERGDEIEVEIKLLADDTVKNIEIEASIKGYEHSNRHKTSVSTDVFDIKKDRVYYKTLEVELPNDLKNEDTYALRIEISDKDHQKIIHNAILEVGTARHFLKIDDVLFSPGTTVQAGRSLLTSVRLENFGQKGEDNVKVSFSIPELGVADHDYIEEIPSEGSGESNEKMTEELYVRIPATAENKEYQAKVTADYDEGYETVEKTYTITVIGGKVAAETVEKTLLNIGPETQNIVANGNEAVYPIAVTNAGSEAKTYTLALTTGNWASSRLSENVLVVKPAETKVAYAYVAANKDASAGEKLVSLKVSSNNQVLKEVTLKANVVKDKISSKMTVKNIAFTGAVVLVILLVIIALIVAFSRLKNKDEENEDEDKTYY